MNNGEKKLKIAEVRAVLAVRAVMISATLRLDNVGGEKLALSVTGYSYF